MIRHVQSLANQADRSEACEVANTFVQAFAESLAGHTPDDGLRVLSSTDVPAVEVLSAHGIADIAIVSHDEPYHFVIRFATRSSKIADEFLRSSVKTRPTFINAVFQIEPSSDRDGTSVVCVYIYLFKLDAYDLYNDKTEEHRAEKNDVMTAILRLQGSSQDDSRNEDDLLDMMAIAPSAVEKTKGIAPVDYGRLSDVQKECVRQCSAFNMDVIAGKELSTEDAMFATKLMRHFTNRSAFLPGADEDPYPLRLPGDYMCSEGARISIKDLRSGASEGTDALIRSHKDGNGTNSLPPVQMAISLFGFKTLRMSTVQRLLMHPDLRRRIQSVEIHGSIMRVQRTKWLILSDTVEVPTLTIRISVYEYPRKSVVAHRRLVNDAIPVKMSVLNTGGTHTIPGKTSAASSSRIEGSVLGKRPIIDLFSTQTKRPRFGVHE